jgi:serine protease
VPPIVSVGAKNPNDRTDALFSNTGPWVTCYTRGASVLSTLPVRFQGGLEPVARYHEDDQRPRETIDPDDYRGGFAVWSGTSFSAPVIAGRVAAALAPRILAEGDDEGVAVARAQDVVRTLQAHPEQ